MDAVKTFASKLLTNKLLLFSSLWVVVMIVYMPAYKAGFIADFIGMYFYIDDVSFLDFLNRSNAEVKSFYQVTQLQLYALIHLFGTSPIPWFLLFTSLHALNGALAFSFFKNLLQDFGVRNARLIALFGMLFFLFNPNITEVTIWKGGYHYLTGILMQIGILIWTRKYLLTGNGKFVVYAIGVFFLSLFTLEIFYITPALTLALILGYSWAGLIDSSTFRSALKKIFLVQAVLFFLHLLLFRISHGAWIAHYGVTNEFSLATGDLLPKVGKYLSNLIFLTGHWPEKTRFAFYEFLSKPAVYYSVSLILILALSILLVRFKKLSAEMQIAAFLLLGIICSLILVSPIYFDDLFSAYNSRRSYQPGLFTYMLVALLIFKVGNKNFSMWFSAFYLLVCLIYTERKVFHWKTAATIQYGILKDFPFRKNDPVLLLNLPSYYKDVRIMPANELNEFEQQMKLFESDTMSGKLYEVSSYNMQHTWDGAHVTVLDSMTLKVTLNQWGTWWMYNYGGAGSYENELYKVNMTDPGHEYILSLKSKPANMAILFQQGSSWKKVDMNETGEQW
ncbi:MAG TPA: hypothetical protein PL009_00145 [Flavipsychrobacter sp.]|nr:hypothetical protein [Flavipsychrobacter sp.]